MQMTSEEIVRDYKQAANKQKQVRVLADLNQTSPSEIRTILAEAGVEGVKKPEKIMPRMPRKKPEENGGPEGLPSVVGRPSDGLARKAPQGGASRALPMESVYVRIEAILAALPEDASECTRSAAADLVSALFCDYVGKRLEKIGGTNETD